LGSLISFSSESFTFIERKRSVKRPFHSLFPILGVLAALTLAHSAFASDPVPFKGTETGVVSGVAFQFPFATSMTRAEGEATHVGHYQLEVLFVVDVRFATAAGAGVLTAANGDRLFLTLEGSRTDVATTVAFFTIIGGTGRFEGATGGWTAYNQFEFPVPTSPNPYTARPDGTISTVGSNKQQ
jgi:hypothetical protein